MPGVSVDLTWGIPRAAMDREVDILARTHVRWVRMSMAWNGVERAGRGVYDQRFVSDMDYALQRVREAGIEVVMPIADGVPYWASADPGKHVDGDGHPQWNRFWRPADFADYGRFTAWVARRYAPLGVHVFEIWNEPNYEHFWPSGPDPRAYVEMLRAAYPAVKQADPRATVLLGGLYQNGAGFLEGVYRAGGGGSFDAVATHAYPGGAPTGCGPRSPLASLCGIASVHGVMAAHGDGSRPVWLTEFGWSTWDDGVSLDQQAEFLSGAFGDIRSAFPYVPVAFAYNLRDNYWLGDDSGSQEGNYGLLRTDFRAKPGFGALASAISGRSGMQELFDFVRNAVSPRAR
ncbi:MAG: polysaccharide biosynthesis protein PslG [Solirubrobacteraceae bacterium]|nr:polysaccharide biosynthesis protein PslG [Solirubrobacteraceae bacterium]